MTDSACGATTQDLGGGRYLGALFTTVLVLTSACVGTPRAESADLQTTAFVGAHVIPMTAGASVLVDQTVLVGSGRILAIGPTSTTPVPRGAVRIDARGHYLLPGLVDAHVHLEHFDDPVVLSRFVAKGVTTVRNMDGRPYILEWKRRVALGELLGPTIYTAGPILDGDPPLLDDNTVVRTTAEARAAVEAQHDAGYDFVKVYTNISREAYDEVVPI